MKSKKVISLLAVLVFVFSNGINAQEFIPIWPKGKMPNSKGLKLKKIEERQRVTQVAEPGMYAFFPAAEEQNGISVLILPPGGYHKLTYNLGGFQVAKWLNTQGITAFVLMYRLPNSPDLKVSEEGPIEDAQRAMKIIRSRAEQWNLNPDKLGLFGASTGGHLASTLGTHQEDFSVINDNLDKFAFAPNFMILVSPVIDMGKYTHEGSLESFLGEKPSAEKIKRYSNQLQVSEKTPPTFLANAQNDPVVNPMNTILFYEAMLKNNVEGTLHVFPKGGHSIGIFNESGLTDLWKELCAAWIKEIFIEGSK